MEKDIQNYSPTVDPCFADTLIQYLYIIYPLLVCLNYFLVNVHKEDMFRIEKEDGREAP